MGNKSGWIIMEDDVISTTTLETAVAQQVTERQASLGRPSPIDFPTFGYLSPMPQPPENGAISQTVYHHLRQLNEMPLPETAYVLQPSPATKVPVLGRLWATIREQAHQLVLFYVNRAVAHETAVNNHTLNTLNELTRLAQSQQEEINRLQKELAQMQKTETYD